MLGKFIVSKVCFNFVEMSSTTDGMS